MASDLISTFLITAAVATWAIPARADVVASSSIGDIKVFTNVQEMAPLLGTAHFDEGPLAGPIPLTTYTAQGMTLHTGPLTQILPGVTTPGNAVAPSYAPADATDFPLPIQGGGMQVAQVARGGIVVTFSDDVTQLGLVAGSQAEQHLSIWDRQGVLIAQIDWVPSKSATFFGVDTVGRPIGMAALGNDNLYSDNADPYTPAVGPALLTDTWMWSLGVTCTDTSDCDDDSVCTGSETCQDGYCIDGLGLDCESDDACQIDSCDPVSGCQHEPINNCCNSDADCPQSGTFCKKHVCVLRDDDPGTTTDDLTTTTDPIDGSTSETTASLPTTTTDDPPLPTSTTDADNTSTTNNNTTDDANTTTLPDTTNPPPSDGPSESADPTGCTCTTTTPTLPLTPLALLLLLPRRRR